MDLLYIVGILMFWLLTTGMAIGCAKLGRQVK